jgi:hypothetical protein
VLHRQQHATDIDVADLMVVLDRLLDGEQTEMAFAAGIETPCLRFQSINSSSIKSQLSSIISALYPKLSFSSRRKPFVPNRHFCRLQLNRCRSFVLITAAIILSVNSRLSANFSDKPRPSIPLYFDLI